MNIVKMLFDAALAAEAELIEDKKNFGVFFSEYDEPYIRDEERYNTLCDLINTLGLQVNYETYREKHSEGNETPRDRSRGGSLYTKNRKGNNKKMELKDTVDLMCSECYENRFLAEYRQTKIRYEKLHRLIIKARAGTLGVKLKYSVELLEAQAAAIGQYLKILEVRAEIEGIEVPELM